MGSNIQEQLELFLNTAVQKKDEEIKTLKEQNDKLKEENERLLKQIGSDIKHKAENLKKALDDFLEHPNSNRTYHPRFQHPPPNFLPVSIPNSNVDVKPSTSTRTDESSVNGPKFHSNRSNFNSNHEDFSSRQEFRTETDAEIINQANPADQHHFHSHSHSQTTLPTPYNGNSQKRFNPNANGFNMNGPNNNNRNNRNNNNNNSNKHTIFVSWPGTATKEQLQELFDSEGIDVADIRYTAQKQFAHVDLKSENEVIKAITLNGVTKSDKQGQLRVEVGKPRSSNPNPTENNGQRPQNQNKNFNRQNNKNLNSYNTSSPQKLSKFNPYNNSNNHHNHHHVGFTTFGATDDKENNSSGWQNNDIPKSESN